MALTVAELNAKLTADTKQFSSAIDKAEQQASSAFDKIGKAGDKLKDVGKKMTAFVTLPLVGAGAAAFKMSSDLAESLNAADVAFGQSSGEIKKWAKDLPAAFGFTQKGALDAAAGFKLVAKDAKLTSTDFAKLAERAADLGSVFNVETTQAADALKSALVGEFEPARRLGVVLNAAQIEARALAMGFQKVGGELPPAAKQAAIYAEIMQQTSFAQGDATKTADTAAGKIRTAKAEMGRMAEEIGSKLIPIGSMLLDKLRGLVDWFSNLSGSQQQTIVIVGLAVAALGPLVAIVGNLIAVVHGLAAAFTFLAANPIVLVIAAVAALVAGLVIAYQKSETFRNIVNAAFNAVRAVAESVFNWIKDHWGLLLTIIAGPVGFAVALVIKNFDSIKGVVQSVWDFVRPIFEAMGKAISKVAGPLGDVLGAVGKVGGAVGGVAGKIGGFLPKFHSGGIVPGPRGADVPILAQAGERVIPAGGSAGGDGDGQPIVVQLVADGRVLQEILLAHQRRSGALGFN